MLARRFSGAGAARDPGRRKLTHQRLQAVHRTPLARQFFPDPA
ncbi:hypothetical protein SAMN05421872_107160 [Nocardioides lianchengensis]|uniref:Uncharacterized protein n=1 Tax=Nocardioides lianchengensis TaxID=1045774 RepID=A0A1G6TQN6_9ACTN|nr:hypothetical protein [Nocardioides lianchengensis]SDD31428.1 hypothetical protein SAMN05421872_107160 [Nocardioides lianchengensis]